LSTAFKILKQHHCFWGQQLFVLLKKCGTMAIVAVLAQIRCFYKSLLMLPYTLLVLQTLERKKKTLLGQKMPFVKGKGRGWMDDALSSEDG